MQTTDASHNPAPIAENRQSSREPADPFWGPRKAVAAAGLLLLIVTLVDYTTGSELHLFLFYFFPIMLCAWYAGQRCGILMALVGGAGWLLVDRLTNNQYSDEIYRYWNAGLRLMSNLVIAITFSRIKASLARERQLNDENTRMLNELRQSMDEIRRLQSQIQIVCAWTKRIKYEGKWISFEEFMQRHFKLQFSHSISEEGMRQIEKEMEPLAAGEEDVGTK
jgi:K+-sensing histidine kinase KdpD